MTVYLVRHAIALGRSQWDDDDQLRPLTKRGQRQADGLVDLLAPATIRRVLSSPAVRCRDTVAPLAARLGIEVEDHDDLAEGASGRRAAHLAAELAARKGDSVLCSHGDVIPDALRWLERHGTKLHHDLEFAKGSTWRLDGDGAVTDAWYSPPPG